MDLQDFQDSLDRLDEARSIEDLAAQCRVHCERLGFDSFVYALRVPTQFVDAKLVLVDGYPRRWVEHYFAREHFRHDPVMAYCARHVVPMQWHELALERGSGAAAMMDEAGEFGVKSGVTMPVHTPQGELGILSFALDRRDAAAHEITRGALPYVQMLAGYMHEAVRRVSGIADCGASTPLTAREQECLRWAADGKTSWEISQVLGMAERTVNFHLNNAMSKLDVSNRQHAVAKAAARGLIQPHPF